MVTPSQRDLPVTADGERWLPCGNGRSYGDSCLNDGGTLVRHAAAGSLHQLRCRDVACCAARRACSWPISWRWHCRTAGSCRSSPGTQFVTVGGAIANDVHGKNHHVAGTFGEHVRSFELLRSDGQRLLCSPDAECGLVRRDGRRSGADRPDDLGRARLEAMPGPWMQTRDLQFDNLDEFFSLSAASGPDFEYTVAWIDCLAKGKALGRGLFSRGDHVAPATPPRTPSRRSRSLPFDPPVSLVNRSACARSTRSTGIASGGREHSAVSHYEPFFYPLDALADWNRMYGPRGFLQYQCVVPPAVRRATPSAELLRAHPAQRLRARSWRCSSCSATGRRSGCCRFRARAPRWRWISRSTRDAACSACSTSWTRWCRGGRRGLPGQGCAHVRPAFPAILPGLEAIPGLRRSAGLVQFLAPRHGILSNAEDSHHRRHLGDRTGGRATLRRRAAPACS